MKDTRKTKLLKSTLNKKLEDFRKLRISNIQKEVVISDNNEKTKSKGFFSKLLNK
ncbi:hypothetical protein FEM08_14520 [Flavobacterium gilvum]|nr:hypothetical protein FEM08_14520 [Flavobacterium gilvum]